MRIQIKLTLAFLLITTIPAISQINEKLAAKHFDNLSYVKSLEYYEHLSKGKIPSAVSLERAGYSARKIGDIEKAEYYYRKLVSKYPNNIESLVQYAYVLKQLEKHGQALSVYKQIFRLDSQNPIAIENLKNTNYYQDLRDEKDRINLFTTNFNSGSDDFSPSYTNNLENEIMFSSNKRSSSVIVSRSSYDNTYYINLYQSVLDSHVKVESYTNYDSKLHDGPVSFSNNGNKMYLTRNNLSDGDKVFSKNRNVNLKIYIAENVNGSWGELKEFKYNSNEYSCGHPTVSDSGTIMYFTSDMPGSIGSTDIFKTELINGEWSKPTSVLEFNTAEEEMFPFLSKNGVVYFSSYGRVGLGGLDMYRAYPLDSGYDVRNLGFPLNTSSDDFGIIIDSAERTGYFSSNRSTDSSKGGDDIYRFTLNYPFAPNFDIRGRVVDFQSKKLLSGSQVKLMNLKTKLIVDSLVSKEGIFHFVNVKPGKYEVIPSKNMFLVSQTYILDSENAFKGEIKNAYVSLQKEKQEVTYIVKNGKNGKNVSDVKLTILNRFTGKEIEVYTNVVGYYVDSILKEELQDSIADFIVTVSKEGFFDRKIEFIDKLSSGGTLIKNVSLIPIEEIDIRKICLINEIYYDLGKWNIRSDAAIELDKLVTCMKENSSMSIEIGSHTDCRGGNSFNQKLSDKRAKSCMNYVISKGIDKSRIYGKGYGEEKLVNECDCVEVKASDCSEEDHQENRRTEFRVVF